MIDKRDQSVTSGNRQQVTVGTGATTGHITNATTIQDSFNTIESSGAPQSVKDELKRLTTAVEQILPHVPAPKRSEVQQDLKALTEEAIKPQPRRQWYELSAKGLVEAAQACGAMAVPVIETVKKLLGLLG